MESSLEIKTWLTGKLLRCDTHDEQPLRISLTVVLFMLNDYTVGSHKLGYGDEKITVPYKSFVPERLLNLANGFHHRMTSVI